MRQQKGCYRTQLGEKACGNQKVAVPLHRQKTLKGYLSSPVRREAAKAKRLTIQDNIINSRSGLTHRSE